MRHPARPAGTRPEADQRGPRAVVAVRRLFAAETPEYFLLLGTTLFMVVFGLVMVLSSSSVEAGKDGGNFFTRFLSQGSFALVGVPVMLLFARVPARFWQKWAWHFVAIGVGLQLLVFVPGLSYGYGGNQNWLKIGGFTAQPSELVKLALVVWLGTVLAKKAAPLRTWKQMLLPVGPVAGVAIGFVLLGKDLGTALIMFAIVLGALFFAGARLRLLLAAVVVSGVFSVLFSMTSSSRQNRIEAWLNGCKDAKWAALQCYQTLHGWWALADGGVVGVGLGNSRGKWSWLPEADSDFIFAIIGEELGLIGAIVVVLLFAVLAFAFVRIIRMQRDRFPMIVTAGVMVWVIGQAFVNIAVVLGMLPVLGVPLPLISKGGTALITTLGAIGVVLSFARHRPEPLAAPAQRTGAQGAAAR
jgi:cell division protein FtsW